MNKHRPPEVRLLSHEDTPLALQLIALFHQVFRTEDNALPSRERLSILLCKPHFRAFVLLHNDEVVGGLTAYELPMLYGRTSELFIYDIAVKPDFQRSGLGKQLLEAARMYCREKGIGSFFVDASSSDPHAVDFYRATGGSEEKVVQFTYLVD